MLGVATGRLPIGRRLATCPTILRRAFIPFGGPKAHDDSQDWPPHNEVTHLISALRIISTVRARRHAPLFPLGEYKGVNSLLVASDDHASALDQDGALNEIRML